MNWEDTEYEDRLRDRMRTLNDARKAGWTAKDDIRTVLGLLQAEERTGQEDALERLSNALEFLDELDSLLLELMAF